MHRSREASETLDILASLIKKSQITRLCDLTHLDNTSSLYVYSAVRPGALSISVSMGKSLSKKQAQCGAVVESLETYMSEITLPQLYNLTQHDVAKEYMVLPIFNNIAISQVDFKLDWNIGYNLTDNRKTAIPSYLVSLNSNNIFNQMFRSNSSGLASGNTFYEALTISLLENIERMAVKENNRVKYIGNTDWIDAYQINTNMQTNIFMYKNLFNIPVVSVELSHKSRHMDQCKFVGSSASYTYEQAMKNALEEAIQSKVGLISGARDDLKDEYYLVRRNKEQSNKTSDSFMYDNLLSKNITELIAELENLIKKAEKDIIVYDYYKDNFYILKTLIVDHESYIC